MTDKATVPLINARRDAWQVYLLECADGTYYCGIAKDAQKRLLQHNGVFSGGAKYTAARRPAMLVACASLVGKGNALRLEAAIKKLPRHKKIMALKFFGQDSQIPGASEAIRTGQCQGFK